MGLTGSLPVAAPMGIHRAVGPQAGKAKEFRTVGINVLVADQERTFADALAARLEAEMT